MLNKRERILAILAVSAIGILGIDRFVLTPITEALDMLGAEEQRLVSELEQVSRVLKQRRAKQKIWRSMTKDGLGTDPSEAERRVLEAVRGWSGESGLTLGSIQPERPVERDELREIGFQATGRGSVEAITRFLYLLEQSTIPIRVERLRVSAIDKSDEMNLEIRVSTVSQNRSRESSVG